MQELVDDRPGHLVDRLAFIIAQVSKSGLVTDQLVGADLFGVGPELCDEWSDRSLADPFDMADRTT